MEIIMSKKELGERNKMLEQRLINLDAKFMGQIAGLKDKYLLTNDRINELLERIQAIERELRQ